MPTAPVQPRKRPRLPDCGGTVPWLPTEESSPFTAGRKSSVDGEVVKSKDVTVGAGNTTTVSFAYPFPSEGNYTAVVAGERLESFEVQPEQAAATETATATSERQPDPSQPFPVWIALVVFVVGLLLAALWRRRDDEEGPQENRE